MLNWLPNAAAAAAISECPEMGAKKEDFPTIALDEGIEEWRKAQGGVFTIPMSQIVGIIDDQTAKAQMRTEASPTVS